MVVIDKSEETVNDVTAINTINQEDFSFFEPEQYNSGRSKGCQNESNEGNQKEEVLVDYQQEQRSSSCVKTGGSADIMEGDWFHVIYR